MKPTPHPTHRLKWTRHTQIRRNHIPKRSSQGPMYCATAPYFSSVIRCFSIDTRPAPWPYSEFTWALTHLQASWRVGNLGNPLRLVHSTCNPPVYSLWEFWDALENFPSTVQTSRNTGSSSTLDITITADQSHRQCRWWIRGSSTIDWSAWQCDSCNRWQIAHHNRGSVLWQRLWVSCFPIWRWIKKSYQVYTSSQRRWNRIALQTKSAINVMGIQHMDFGPPWEPPAPLFFCTLWFILTILIRHGMAVVSISPIADRYDKIWKVCKHRLPRL